MSDFDVQVIRTDDYPLVVLVDREGHALVRSNTTPEYAADVAVRLVTRFHAAHDVPLTVTPELAELLTAAGWAPPAEDVA